MPTETKRNDFSHIPEAVITANRGKFVAFVSKDNPVIVTLGVEAPLVTTIIAAANNKSDLYLNSLVVAAGDAIDRKDNNGTNTDRETLIIHYIEPPQPE